MFEVLVVSMIGILVAFTIAWAVLPNFREWIERPKHTMLERERRFDSSSADSDIAPD